MHKWLRDESGNILIMFGLASVMLMIAISVGIEAARYSVAKTKMQQSLDLAVLSAASVRESQDYHQVGNDMFASNYPAEFMNTDFISSGVGGPVVMNWDATNHVLSGHVEGTIKTYLGAFVGIDRLKIDQYAEVIEEQRNESRPVEVALTIDNSTSMCKGSVLSGNGNVTDPTCAKHNAVKTATRNFVDDLYADDAEGVYIGVVPFNHNVRMGSRHPLLNHDPFAVWIHAALPAHLASRIAPPPLPNTEGLSNNPATVRSRIDAISIAPGTWGFTRTNVGTLTAGLMLMPYPEDTAFFNHVAGAPHEFGRGMNRADKVLVLLTDGENVTHYLNRNDRNISNDVPMISDEDNQHQLAVCNMLKDHYGVTIFSVTYDLPNGPVKDIFRQCAKSPDYYFDATSTTDLNLAYTRIAESIKQIRLHK